MTTQLSFSKQENEVLPEFRNKIGKAESTEDAKKIFAQTAGHLMAKVFGEAVSCEYGDLALAPEGDTLFTVSDRLHDQAPFRKVWQNSDLPHVLGRMAQSAVNRYKHLEKNPEKTNAKIRN